VGWFVALGLGTILAGAVVIYWREVKKPLPKGGMKMLDGVNLERNKFVGSAGEDRQTLNLEVEQIVLGTLVWTGYKRFEYIEREGEWEVIWAKSEEIARETLADMWILPIIFRQTAYAPPTLRDIIAYSSVEV
jgi:hypothetical protein